MLPLPFIIPAIIAGGTGAAKTVKGFADNYTANRIVDDANARVSFSKDALDRSRHACSSALEGLGNQKLSVLNGSIARFIASFEQIKNMEVADSLGLEELKKLKVDPESLADLQEMQQFAAVVAGGAAAGITGGALTALGAYNAAMSFATASTGTAIATLNGAAATNATLAFFGGGSLAAGGAGMAGGVIVLGGIVAGPALLVMGLIAGKKADQKLEIAKEDKSKADQMCAELDHLAVQCDAIRRRTYMFYAFLARLDARLVPLVIQLEDVLASEGDDYLKYSEEAKSIVLRSATMAGSVKSLLDTPILTEDGALTAESGQILALVGAKVDPE